MFKQVKLIAILIIAFTSTVTGQATKNLGANNNVDAKWEESLGGAEAAKAIARLGDLSPAAIREHLKQMRQPAYSPDSVLINKIIERHQLQVATGEQIDRLKVALKPVLAYHRREQMPIIVAHSEQPKAILVDCLTTVITTKLMAITSDAEIRGLIAHELAHEYIWDEHKKARLAKDKKLMKECELFCDAVAAFTLKEIGDDPASYARVLERMALIGAAAGKATGRESNTHPSLDARKKLNKFLCQRLDLNLKKSPQP